MNALNLVYIHVIEGATGGPGDNLPFDYRALKARFSGAYIANNGYTLHATRYTLDLAERAIASGDADLIFFRKPFISNPNLVERLKTKKPLKEPDRKTFYGGGAEGYTDY